MDKIDSTTASNPGPVPPSQVLSRTAGKKREVRTPASLGRGDVRGGADRRPASPPGTGAATHLQRDLRARRHLYRGVRLASGGGKPLSGHLHAITGTVSFSDFEHRGPSTFTIDDSASRFHYLRLNPATAEAEMRYHIEFLTTDSRRYTLEGIKYMHKDSNDPGELLADYTTLFCRLQEGDREAGTALLKFRKSVFGVARRVLDVHDPALQRDPSRQCAAVRRERVGNQ